MTNLIRSNFQDHPFHLVSPSPWPLYTSICLLNLTTSAALSMHNFSNSYYINYISLLLVVSVMSFWFRDIISEATYLGDHTLAVQKGLNLGVILFIVSEALFFVAIFWAFFHSALTPTVELGAQWPPIGIEPVNPFELPLLNTVILLSSGATVTWAHHSLIEGERKGSLYGSVATVLLAVIFTIFQGVEYSVSSFTISDGAFGACFFFGTGYYYIFFLIILFYSFFIVTLVSCESYYNALKLPNESKGDSRNSGGGLCFRTGLGNFKNSFINKRQYSTSVNVLSGLKKESILPPYWVTGFADAESSFNLKVSKKNTSKIGWHVIPEFNIELHSRDTLLLRKIQSFFGIGIISERLSLNKVVYSVQSYKDIINVIIPHFDKYPLVTQKKADYLLFKQAINLLNLNAKSNMEGFRSILSLKASMNSGLSATLKINFPTILPEPRPIVSSQVIPDPNWFTGFVDGEGCFYVKLSKSNAYLSGFQVGLNFLVYQHARDEYLLTSFIEYLGCGKIEIASTRSPSGDHPLRGRSEQVKFVVYKFSDIFEKIIPFFQRHSLQGIKHMDYLDFCKVADIVKDKYHLTPEGVKAIKSLKSGMNTGRIYE